VTELTIDAQNAETVAAEGVRAVELLSQMSELVETFSGAIENPSAQVIIPCDTGNVSIAINDVPPLNVLSTNDSASFTFNACVLNAGGAVPVTLNGAMSFTATEVTGTQPGPYSAKLTCSFRALSVVILGATVVVDGGFTLEASTTDGVTFVNAVSGTYFSAFAQAGSEAFSGTIWDFRVERTVDESTGAFSVDVQATFAGSQTNGIVSIVATTPFDGVEPDHPDTGVMVVTGAGGSTLTFTTLDNVDVQLDVDVDGDGTPEVTILTTWDFLDSQP
jgi:hypothetical protein